MRPLEGVRLADVLKAAGLKPEATQILFNGLDTPHSRPPDFVKTLEPDLALNPELLLAYEMNGEPLPWLNGFPLRLVIPGTTAPIGSNRSAKSPPSMASSRDSG